jgi:hypothetical protein
MELKINSLLKYKDFTFEKFSETFLKNELMKESNDFNLE